MTTKAIPIRSIAIAITLGAWALAASAQGFPGGGGGGMNGARGMNRADPRGDAAGMREPMMRPHVMGLFAAALEKEAPSLELTPAAAAATSDFVRELKDFAALDERHVRDRIGLMRTVHGAIDLQRDLKESQAYARELAEASADLLARWTKLHQLLDQTQRERIEAIYGMAQLDSRRPPGERN